MHFLKDRFFIMATIAFTVCAIVWGLALPAYEAPDEQNHYRYMVFLKDFGRLPRQLPLPPEVLGEGHQPPLYYVLGGLFLRAVYPEASFVEPPLRSDVWFDRQPVYFEQFVQSNPFDVLASHRPVHAVRLAHLFLPLLSLGCLWILLSYLSISDGVRRTTFVLLALNPGWCFLAGALNNDHLAVATSSVVILVLTRAASKQRFEPWMGPFLGLFLGLGSLAKLSVLPLLPITAVALWMWSPRPRRDLAWLVGLTAGLAGWWYGRNLILYGDAFGWTMHRLTCPNTLHHKSVFNLAWWQFWSLRSFESAWSVFGWLTWRAPLIFTWLVAGVCVGAIIGVIRRLVLARIEPPNIRIGFVLGFAFMALWVGVARFGLEFDPPEGRYFFPGLLPVGAGLALGWSVWFKNKDRYLKIFSWVLLTSMALFNVWLVGWRLIPFYYK